MPCHIGRAGGIHGNTIALIVIVSSDVAGVGQTTSIWCHLRHKGIKEAVVS